MLAEKSMNTRLNHENTESERDEEKNSTYLKRDAKRSLTSFRRDDDQYDFNNTFNQSAEKVKIYIFFN